MLSFFAEQEVYTMHCQIEPRDLVPLKLNYFQLINIFNVLIIVFKFSIKINLHFFLLANDSY